MGLAFHEGGTNGGGSFLATKMMIHILHVAGDAKWILGIAFINIVRVSIVLVAGRIRNRLLRGIGDSADHRTNSSKSMGLICCVGRVSLFCYGKRLEVLARGDVNVAASSALLRQDVLARLATGILVSIGVGEILKSKDKESENNKAREKSLEDVTKLNQLLDDKKASLNAHKIGIQLTIELARGKASTHPKGSTRTSV